MAFNLPYDEKAEIKDLSDRLADICNDYDTPVVFVVLAELLTLRCAECTNIAGLDEFIQLFAARVRSIWLERQSIAGRPQ